MLSSTRSQDPLSSGVLSKPCHITPLLTACAGLCSLLTPLCLSSQPLSRKTGTFILTLSIFSDDSGGTSLFWSVRLGPDCFQTKKCGCEKLWELGQMLKTVLLLFKPFPSFLLPFTKHYVSSLLPARLTHPIFLSVPLAPELCASQFSFRPFY